MENNINIAELLKDCPKGTELYLSLCGKCKLKNIDLKSHFSINLEYPLLNSDVWATYELQSNGKIRDDGECLLFPSKEVRDWGCFRVKYVHLTDNPERNKSLLALLGDKFEQESIELTSRYFIAYKDAVSGIIKSQHLGEYASEYILSTGTELRLEEEQPKFKVGDVIKWDDVLCAIKNVRPDCYSVAYWCRTTTKLPSVLAHGEVFDSEIQRLATSEEIAEWNEDVLQPNHLHYSKSKRRIIHWFLPFDKCIMRRIGERWTAAMFSYASMVGYGRDKQGNSIGIRPEYFCLGNCHTVLGFDECLPYNNETAKLIGTTNDWEEK